MDDRLRLLQRSVGRRISDLRKAADLTQHALAQECGIDLKYQQDIEGGRQNLTLKTLLKEAEGLGVEVASLFEPPESLEANRGPGRPRNK